MTLDRYMDDFGHDLARAGRARRRRRRRVRLALALPARRALAVTVAALPGTEGGVDAVAAAREALAPSDEIVHMKVQMKHRQERELGPTTEQWYARRSRALADRRIDPRADRATARRSDAPRSCTRTTACACTTQRRDVVTIYRATSGPSDGPGHRSAATRRPTCASCSRRATSATTAS